MGLLAETVSRALKAAMPMQGFSGSVPVWQSGHAQLPNTRYDTYAREGYMKNELVYACIEELSTSAAEPRMHAKIGGEWTTESPILDLLNRPNPFMDRFEFWATVIMHRALAGNAYALKVRSRAGKVVELWLLRPDRVRVVPSVESYISHYEYQVGGGEAIKLPTEDVLHFKTRHPLDDWYGMPPLMAISGRTDIDNYMKDFVKSAFQNGGMPGAVLSIKSKVSPDDKEAIRNRFRNSFSGPAGWHELLILDNTDSSYTPMTMSLGQRGLVIPELDEIEEARIPMAFGVPQSLIGTRTSYQNGGYANKRAEEQHFWTGTLIPMYKELAGPLNLRLAPDFVGVKEVGFDTSDVWALQKDEAELHAMLREDARAGILELQLAREKMGYPPEWDSKAVFLIPSSSVGVSGEDIRVPEDGAANAVPPSRQGEGGGENVQALALNGAQIASLLTLLQEVTARRLAPETAKDMLRVSFPNIDEATIVRLVDSAANFTPAPEPSPSGPPASPAPQETSLNRVGRPRLENDPEARALWEKGERYRETGFGVTNAQVAAYLGISETTYYRYKAAFSPE